MRATLRRLWRRQEVKAATFIADLDVAVWVIGAGGERSEMEGEWPPQGTRTGLGRPEGEQGSLL